MNCRLVVTVAAVMLASGADGAIQYLTQNRAVYALFNFPMQMQSGSETVPAPDFGPFVATASPARGGYAWASQNSVLGESSITASGAMWTLPVNQPNITTASSTADVTFSLAEASAFTLSGTKDLFATLTLTGPGVNINAGSLTSFNYSGVMQPGTYTFHVQSAGSAGYSGGFDLQLTIPAPGVLIIVLSAPVVRSRRRR